MQAGTDAVNGTGGIAISPLGVGSDDAEHVAVVPGSELPLLKLDIPPRLRGAAREDVARRHLRDLIGSAADSVEMRPFQVKGGADDWRRMFVADVARLEEWRQQAHAGCRAILPDYLVLPAAQDLWTVQVAGASVLARLGLEDGFSAEAPLALLMLRKALDDGPPKAVLLLGESAEIAALFAGHQVPALRSAEEAEALGLARPVVLQHGEWLADLRMDPRAARDRLRAQIRVWIWPAAIAIVAAVLWSAAQILGTRAAMDELARQKADTLQIVRAHFVPEGPVLDVRLQVSRALIVRQGEAREALENLPALSVFGQVAQVIAQTGAEAQDVFYENHGLAVILRARDFASAEAVVDAMKALPLAVSVEDLRVSDDGNGVRVELRIGGQP